MREAKAKGRLTLTQSIIIAAIIISAIIVTLKVKQTPIAPSASEQTPSTDSIQ